MNSNKLGPQPKTIYHHLPEMPSSSEVEKNGVKLAEMNAKLLQKVEELTLYMLQLSKDVEKLKKENEELKKGK